mgnify:CR=1 FL=1
MNHIIGSGLSAFSFCYFSGKKSIIYEKEDYFGGRIQSQKYSKNFIELLLWLKGISSNGAMAIFAFWARAIFT